MVESAGEIPVLAYRKDTIVLRVNKMDDYRNRIKTFQKIFSRMLREKKHTRKQFFEAMQLFYGFYFSDIRLIRKTNWKKKSKMPVLITIVRDEKERIEIFLDHYRNLGIERFVVADNGSIDGTVDYLLRQKDVDLFSIKSKFRNGRKEGWINRLMRLYGGGKWYLIVDADELLEWPERETYSLRQALRILERNKINRAGALMIDMYTKGELYKSNVKKELEYQLYFDADTYEKITDDNRVIYTGGPRGRLYDMECYLSKYPLIYSDGAEILADAHYWYPNGNYKEYPFVFGLLHLKFLTDTDLKKVRQYVNEKNHVNRSSEYKRYLEQYKKGNRSFFYADSVRYESPASLCKIKYIELISKLNMESPKRNK